MFSWTSHKCTPYTFITHLYCYFIFSSSVLCKYWVYFHTKYSLFVYFNEYTKWNNILRINLERLFWDEIKDQKKKKWKPTSIKRNVLINKGVKCAQFCLSIGQIGHGRPFHMLIFKSSFQYVSRWVSNEYKSNLIRKN